MIQRYLVFASLVLYLAFAVPHGFAQEPAVAANRDVEVLEAVLFHLLHDRARNNPLQHRNVGLVTEIRFDPQLQTFRHDLSDIQRQFASLPLSGEERALFEEMVVNLIERSGTQERLPDFHPPDPRLVVAKDLSLPVDGYDETVTGWLPGYSSQGDHAMVKLSIPWSVHFVEATYWLSKSDGHWKVQWRKFTYYL